LIKVNRGEVLPPDDDAFRQWHAKQKQKHKQERREQRALKDKENRERESRERAEK